MIKIDINLVFTIINLLVLYLLMKKFLFGPIINVMDQRKAMIDQQFAEAKERQDNAKALQQLIPLDEMITIMYTVGKKLPAELRETALGGCATAPSACEACHICS